MSFQYRSDRSDLAVHDALGREIQVGDVCTYPVRRGSKMWVNVFTVARIIVPSVRGPVKVHGVRQDGGLVVVTQVDRITIAERFNDANL